MGLTIGSPTQIAANLTAERITTKAWTTQEGQTRSGARIDKKYLHKLLRNRIYLGELSHKGSWYPGVHQAIIDPGLWGRVHEVLARDGHTRSVETKIRSRTDALLRGLLRTIDATATSWNVEDPDSLTATRSALEAAGRTA